VSGAEPAVPAASLILLREAVGGYEVLLVQRAAAMAFAGGAMVFPGGRVDPEDRLAAAALPGLPDAAARIAALRETWEETGIAAGFPAPAPGSVARACVGAAERLVPFARWQPPAGFHHRRFDTRFFLAEAGCEDVPQADGTETVAAFWIAPRAALERVASGAASLLFPTRCLLERLAALPDPAAVRAQALALPPVLIEPAREQHGGETWLVIPDGLGYPYRRERLTGTRES
jgi:8-oxo-dGTP pyrophosphatase MutT (NUDIX family)